MASGLGVMFVSVIPVHWRLTPWDQLSSGERVFGGGGAPSRLLSREPLPGLQTVFLSLSSYMAFPQCVIERSLLFVKNKIPSLTL